MGMATRDPDCKSHPIPISWGGGHTPVCMQVAMPLSPGNPGGRGRVLCTGQAVPLHAGSPGGSSKEVVFKGHFGDALREHPWNSVTQRHMSSCSTEFVLINGNSFH